MYTMYCVTVTLRLNLIKTSNCTGVLLYMRQVSTWNLNDGLPESSLFPRIKYFLPAYFLASMIQ